VQDFGCVYCVCCTCLKAACLFSEIAMWIMWLSLRGWRNQCKHTTHRRTHARTHTHTHTTQSRGKLNIPNKECLLVTRERPICWVLNLPQVLVTCTYDSFCSIEWTSHGRNTLAAYQTNYHSSVRLLWVWGSSFIHVGYMQWFRHMKR
jgi:hypothetical protein